MDAHMKREVEKKYISEVHKGELIKSRREHKAVNVATLREAHKITDNMKG